MRSPGKCGMHLSIIGEISFVLFRFQLDEKFLEISYGANTRKKIYYSGWHVKSWNEKTIQK